MKILLVYYEPIRSGQTTHVLSIARALGREHSITVMLPQQLAANDPHLTSDFLSTGAMVEPLAIHKILWSYSAARKIVDRIRRESYDVVHIHSQEAGISGRILARVAGARRIIYTPQTIDVRRKAGRFLYTTLEVLLSRLTHCIISVNQRDRDRLIQWGIAPHKVVTLHNGIDFPPTQPVVDRAHLRQALGIAPHAPVVMQVGRLSVQKAPQAFIQGAVLVLRAVPAAQFYLIGDGPLYHDLIQQVQSMGLEQSVHVLGRKPQARHWMNAADVITLTSRWEGTPYAMLEGMACGKPLVATDVNGCREVVQDGENGYLTLPDDVPAWADRVIQLLRDPARAHIMGQAGFKLGRARFTIENMIDRLLSLYAE